MLVHWIWLSTRSGLSDRGRMALLRHFADAEEIFFASPDAYGQVEGLSEDAVASLQDKDMARSIRILDQCDEKGIQILCWPDQQRVGALVFVKQNNRVAQLF